MNARAGGAFRDFGHEAGLRARLPGDNVPRRRWSHLSSREGNAGRNIPPERMSSFTEGRAASGPRDDVFAGSDGRVFRRSESGWEEHRGAAWSGVNRVPDAHPTYRPAPMAPHYGGSFARPEAGLDRDFAARSRGGFQENGFRGGNSGGFRGGGGSPGGWGGGRGAHRYWLRSGFCFQLF